MTPIAIAFGSNVGDRAATIARALEALRPYVRIGRVSGLYETPPMYREDQAPFLNGALVGETGLDPLALLLRMKEVESTLGRQDRGRNGPREIDLDLIAYGALRLQTDARPELVVPHPRAAERRFVLAPLLEIAPELKLPGIGIVAELHQSPGIQRQNGERVSDAPILVPRS